MVSHLKQLLLHQVVDHVLLQLLGQARFSLKIVRPHVNRDRVDTSIVYPKDNVSAQLVGGEGDYHARLDHTSLNTTNGKCSNATNFGHILQDQD